MEPGAGLMADGDAGFVPDTRFGEWFQRSDIWCRYVVEEATAELLSLLPAGHRPFATVLDAGCGEGVSLPLLQDRLAPQRLVAIDINPLAVDAARRVAARLGGHVEVRRADAARLPLADASVDLVYCHQLLHHAAEPPAVLAELLRVLVPGGWLLLAESCRSFLEWWPVRLLFRHPPREQQTADAYVEWVRAAGFELGSDGILLPAPWWSRTDLGLRERFGGIAGVAEATQVRIAARRPPAG